MLQILEISLRGQAAALLDVDFKRSWVHSRRPILSASAQLIAQRFSCGFRSLELSLGLRTSASVSARTPRGLGCALSSLRTGHQ